MVATEFIWAMALMILLIVFGVSIFTAMGLSLALVIEFTGIVPMSYVGDNMFVGLRSFVLLAIPLFILTGDIIVESGLSSDLLEFADSIVGGFQSGVGSATVLGCGLFASITGSNASDAAAIARITYDDLQQYGYPSPYSCALIASGASTGILIPPSIVYIVAGIILGISTSALFLAAFIPGIMILLGVMATNVLVNRRLGYESGHAFGTPQEMLIATWNAKIALATPVIILGGIYSGVFTPTESAAAAVLVILLSTLPKGELSLADFPDMFDRSAAINGTIAPILAVAILFGNVISLYRIPTAVVDLLLGTAVNEFQIIMIMFLIFVVSGAIMETGPNLVILGPLLLPTAVEIGMDPIHYTVFMVSTLGVGFITPPFGLNLFVMSGITGESVDKIAKAALPFVLVLLVIVLGIAFLPSLYMWTVA